METAQASWVVLRSFTFVASAALLQGQVASNLPDFVAEALGLDSDAERALQFARSAPGVAATLVGMKRAAHVRENLEVLQAPPLSEAGFAGLFQH